MRDVRVVQIPDQGIVVRVRGLGKMSPEDRRLAEKQGAAYVFFEYCISLIFLTLRRPSDVYFVQSNQRYWHWGLLYSLISLLLGWWGIPWGIIYTPLTIITNLGGGQDVTEQMSEILRAHDAAELD